MPRAVLQNGVELEYDTFGSSNDKALLLIMGLATQMIAWTEAFCELLASHGFYVIRFDNRDVGLSSHMDHLPLPRASDFFRSVVLGKKVHDAYLIKDMAEDALGLLDHMGVSEALVCGASMGGMIAQELAIHYPGRVKSLCLIMTSPGNRRLPKPRFNVMLNAIKKPVNNSFEAKVKYKARRLQVIGSVGTLAPDMEYLLARCERSIKRSPRERGALRQSYAIINSPDRSKGLKKISQPTLIIHGQADPLVRVHHAYALKDAIPHARMELIKDMGHDLPQALYQNFAQWMKELVH